MSDDDRGEEINIDSEISEDDEPTASDIEAIDPDDNMEENVDHSQLLAKRGREEASEAHEAALATAERLANVSGYTDDEFEDTGRVVEPRKKRRKRLQRQVSDSDDEAPSQPASQPQPLVQPAEEPPVILETLPLAKPLKIPAFVENPTTTRVVYQPACAMPSSIVELGGQNSAKINVAFLANMLPLDLANITDRDFEVFQAIFLILNAIGTVEVEGGKVNCAYWAVGKRRSSEVHSLKGVLKAMTEHYAFSRTIFRIFFHTENALSEFSQKLLKCQDMLDSRDSRAAGPSCMNILKRYIQNLPGLSPARRKSLVNRIFVKPFQFSRGVVFLAQSQGTIRRSAEMEQAYTAAAIPCILTAATATENGFALSDNWTKMFGETNVFRALFERNHEALHNSLSEAIQSGDLLHAGEEQYTWTLSNTLRVFEYSAFIPKTSFGDSRDGGFGEKVMHYNEDKRLHQRIEQATHDLLRVGVGMDKYREALSVVNNYKGTPSSDKWKWEYNQASDLVQAFHMGTILDTPGFYLEEGVRPGSAWLKELWMGVENGMLSNSLHGAVASMIAVVYGSIRINELEQPNFFGHGQHSAGKSRCAEHCDDLTGDIIETTSWMSEQAQLTDSGAGIAFFPEGSKFLTSTDEKNDQAKKNMKAVYGKSRTNVSKRFNVKTGCNDSITTTNLKTSIYVMNDRMNEDHIQNQALFSRGITFDFDHIVKNSDAAPAQQLSISESDQRHQPINKSYHLEGRLRTSLFNFYDACRCFMNWSVSVDTLGWVFQFLKSIQVGGQVLVTARVTNHVRIFMENYQMHLCCTVLYNKMDVPDMKNNLFGQEDVGTISDCCRSSATRIRDVESEITAVAAEHEEQEKLVKGFSGSVDDLVSETDRLTDLKSRLKKARAAHRAHVDSLDPFEEFLVRANLPDDEFSKIVSEYLASGEMTEDCPQHATPRMTILCKFVDKLEPFVFKI